MKTLQTMALTTLSLAAACSSTSQTLKGATHMKPAIYVFESDANGFNTKTMFYDNGEEVVVFDAQFTPQLAEQAITFLRTKTQNPITKLVITHPNPDKFNGASVFKNAGAEVISSKLTANAIPGVHAYKKYFFVNMAKMFTDETYPTPIAVDRVFDTKLDLVLKNGERIELSESALAGVSTNQTTAFIPEINALIVGDLVHNKAHAWLEGGIQNGKAVPTLKSWIQNLRQLAQTTPNDALVYGGRGNAVGASKAFAEQITYLEKADQLVSHAVAILGTDAASILNGSGANAFYADLTKSFEASFPDYSLAYMIQYGSYGLAQSKISNR